MCISEYSFVCKVFNLCGCISYFTHKYIYFFIEPQRHREHRGRESADVYILEYVLKFDD